MAPASAPHEDPVADDSHWYVYDPVPPVGATGPKVDIADPEQTVCPELISLPNTAGVSATAELISVQLPTDAFRLNQVFWVNTPDAV